MTLKTDKYDSQLWQRCHLQMIKDYLAVWNAEMKSAKFVEISSDWCQWCFITQIPNYKENCQKKKKNLKK